MKEKIVELEMIISHNEKTITELSDTIYAQQKQIDNLGKKIKMLGDKIEEVILDPMVDAKDEPPPPHY